MKDLTILHLSDLHIDGKGKKYSKILAALLNDIRNQIKNIPNKTLVVVVTGDIINRGAPEALDNAKKFFTDLKNIVSDKIVALYIVPGNHDKHRSKFNNFAMCVYRSGENYTFNDEFRETVWPQQMDSYKESNYIALMKYIYTDIFEMKDIGEIAEKTYGVHVININGERYAFVLLNTAWSSGDDFDSRRLLLGKFQLDDLCNDFSNLTDENPVALTFILGHHPIEMLRGEEQDELFKRMISYTDINANIYLCGHTHDRNIINWTNDCHAIYTFMTGIGWPEVSSDRIHDHYYSLYTFNLDLNAIDIFVRRTADDINFIADLGIYTTGNNKNRFNIDKIVRPIYLEKVRSEITLSTSDISKEMFVSDLFLESSKRLFQCMNNIMLDTGEVIRSYQRELCDQLIKSSSVDENSKSALSFWCEIKDYIELYQNEDVNKCLEKLFFEHKSDTYNYFQSFIQRLCVKIKDELLEETSQKGIIRFHFRYLNDKSSELYNQLCASFSDCTDEIKEQYELSSIKYGDLLEAAYKNDKSGCLIYSLNEDICVNKLNPKWHNYITVVPKFEKNSYTKPIVGGRNKKFPIITFGVTSNSSEFDVMLYCMDYYEIDKYISKILQLFVNLFYIDLEDFISWIKKIDKEEAK